MRGEQLAFTREWRRMGKCPENVVDWSGWRDGKGKILALVPLLDRPPSSFLI